MKNLQRSKPQKSQFDEVRKRIEADPVLKKQFDSLVLFFRKAFRVAKPGEFGFTITPKKEEKYGSLYSEIQKD